MKIIGSVAAVVYDLSTARTSLPLFSSSFFFPFFFLFLVSFVLVASIDFILPPYVATFLEQLCRDMDRYY